MCYCEHNIVCGLYFTLSLSLSRQREGDSPSERVFLVSKVTFSGGE